MSCHRISERFYDDDFNIKILAESPDRSEIEDLEEYYIKYYDTYNNGLNNSEGGKGYGHNDPKFTTLGYKFTDEQRRKMSEAGKKRALREGFDIRSKRSKTAWQNEEYRKRQSEIRKNKRLRPPKLTDDQVAEIRKRWDEEKADIISKVNSINESKINSSHYEITPHGYFAKQYSDYYNVTTTTIKNVILWKTRTRVLPSVCKS